MRWMLGPLAAVFLMTSHGLEAQVTLSAAVNAASYLNASLPNGNLAEGSIFIAFGKGLGPTKLSQISQFPLGTSLSGTSISATVGGKKVDCIILYTTATQVAAVLPSSTPAGSGTMVATYNGASSAPLNITVAAHDLGIFAVNQAGTGAGVLTDAITNVVNSTTASAKPNELVDIWGTGLGPVTGDEAGGPLPGPIPNLDIQVFVGNQPAQVIYAGRSGCCTGLDQIRISIPAGVSGCYVPVYFVVGGVVSNFVTVSIAQTGSACSDPGGYDPALLQTAQKNGGLRVGTAYLNRVHGYTKKMDYQGDSAGAAFVKIPLAALQQAGQAPEANSCVVTQFPGGPTVGVPTGLDAGKVNMSGPIGSYDLASPAAGYYNVAFLPTSGASVPGVVNDGTVLLPGNYTISGAGGKDVGVFSASIPLPDKLDWTNRPAVPVSISRGQPLTITWAHGYAGALLEITGQSQASLGVGAQFQCWADATAGSFTVPVGVMSPIPATYTNGNTPQGSLAVTQFYMGPSFNAPGVDYTSVQFADGFDMAAVTYR